MINVPLKLIFILYLVPINILEKKDLNNSFKIGSSITIGIEVMTTVKFGSKGTEKDEEKKECKNEDKYTKPQKV